MFATHTRRLLALTAALAATAGPAWGGLAGPPPPIASCSAPLVQGDGIEDDDQEVQLGPEDDHFAASPALVASTTRGGDGADCLLGGTESDRLEGEGGNDWLVGGLGGDAVIGGPGDDVLFAGAVTGRTDLQGDESIRGGDGDDVALPGRGDTTISLGSGDDRVLGTDGSAGSIDCGPGEDTVQADVGDVLEGCEHVTRRAAPRVRVGFRNRTGTVAFRSPWPVVRPGDDIIDFGVAVRRPHRRGCGGVRSYPVDARKADVRIRLVPGRKRPCSGRWTVQPYVSFELDAASCDDHPCDSVDANVGPKVAFRMP